MKRVPRSDLDRIASCEFHLLALWEAYVRASVQPERYKQMAAELRVLVCRHGRNKPLLLNLMKTHSIEARVNPQSSRYLKKDWQIDTIYKRELNNLPPRNYNYTELVELLHSRMPSEEPLDYEQYISDVVAVANEYGEYTCKELILAVAQQIGSGHEDEAVDELLHYVCLIEQVNNVRPTILGPLMRIAEEVLALGSMFVFVASQHYAYCPRCLDVTQYSHGWQACFPQV